MRHEKNENKSSTTRRGHGTLNDGIDATTISGLGKHEGGTTRVLGWGARGASCVVWRQWAALSAGPVHRRVPGLPPCLPAVEMVYIGSQKRDHPRLRQPQENRKTGSFVKAAHTSALAVRLLPAFSASATAQSIRRIGHLSASSIQTLRRLRNAAIHRHTFCCHCRCHMHIGVSVRSCLACLSSTLDHMAASL